MSNNFRLRITNHRKIFFNYTRDIKCFSCEKDLHDSYTVSGNRGKTRCVPCAVKYHIIDEVPEEIKESVWYGFKIISRVRIYWSRYDCCSNISICNNRFCSQISTYRTLKMIREMKLAMTWNFWKLFLTGKLG